MADERPYRFLEIADILADRIRTAETGYKPGDQIPGESALANEFSVSPPTARHAVDVLRRRGLVHTRRRSATRVRAVHPILRTPDRFAATNREQGQGAYAAELARLGLIHGGRYLKLGPGPCPGDDAHTRGEQTAAELLGVEPGTVVMVRDRLMTATALDSDGQPIPSTGETVQIATSYIPLDLAVLDSRILSEDTGPGGVYSRLADVGHGVARGYEWPSARTATDEEARLLDLGAGGVVQTVDRQAFDAAGRVVEVCRHRMAPGTFLFRYEFPIDPEATPK